jgi:ribosomal protein S18 acetylase RimI-like enzyme
MSCGPARASEPAQAGGIIIVTWVIRIVSVNVESAVVDRGDDQYVGASWELKERIRESEGVLRQRERFFCDAYRRSCVYLYIDRSKNQLIGFAAVRSDGYILFLAVNEMYRGHGFGKRLVARVSEEYGTVSCHARASNQDAIAFYEHLGFEVRRHIDNYYEDGGDALYLILGDESIRSKLSNLIRG